MKLKKILCLLVCAMILLTGTAFAEETGGGLDLTGMLVIIHTNDSHGRVDDNLGFTTVGALKEMCVSAGADVLLLDAGDTFHGLPFATVTEGESIVSIMNKLGYDAMVPGNHDFNYGTDRLLELADLAEFPIISANVISGATSESLLPASIVVEKGSRKVGIFGLSTPETAYKTNPTNVEGVQFADPIEAAQAQVSALKEQGCSYIIALGHIGMDESSEVTSEMIAQAVPGIDLFVDGHSHTTLESGKQVGSTLIVSSGDYIQNVGFALVDGEGKTTAALLTAEDIGENGAFASGEVDQVIDAVSAGIDVLLGEEIGTAEVELVGERALARTSETNLGNLAADAMIAATGADIALTNGGGIRASIPAGPITRAQIIEVFPFGNYVCTVEITGTALIEALELGVGAWPEQAGGFPQVAGFSFAFDGSKEAGQRISEVLIGGQPIDPEAVYTLATNDFMAAGGDQYTMLSTGIVGEFASLEEVMIEYISSLGGSVAPAIEGRTVELSGSALDDAA